MRWLYILDGHNPVPEPDGLKWAEWFEGNGRIVKQTEIGATVVSTVFIGIDNRLDAAGSPLLFETMLFTDGEPSSDLARHMTWDEAVAYHDRAVTMQQLAGGVR